MSLSMLLFCSGFNVFLFLMQMVYSVGYLITLHEGFIYLEIKLLPKRKWAAALLL